ncbi:MAG: T9SS type A sorting domain-containing protein [Aquaticitalea sp.]
MKKTTQNTLSKRLAQYGALTVAIAGTADASGQIVYTDVSPDYNGGVNTDYALDLNNDGTIDFEFNQMQASYYSGIVIVNNLLVTPMAVTNEALVDDPSAGAYAYPFALNSGDVISNGQVTWNNNGFSTGYQSLNWALSYYGSLYANDGNFVGVTDKFVGLRFDVAGQTHYGWARLDVDANATSWVVKDYAYNSVPDQPINAGQTLGINQTTMNNIKVVALNKSIALYNLPENTSYRLLSTSGQSVLNGETNSDTFVIEADEISTGVYILELNDSATKSVIRKKLIL